MPEGRYDIPPEAQPDPEKLMAQHGKVMLLTNRDAIDPEGWNRVADGLPPCPTMKPEGLCWDVYDPKGGVRVCTLHPGNWNNTFTYIEDGRKKKQTEVVTHWRDRPKPPE